MSKKLLVVWDEITRHRQTFTVADDFPETLTGDYAEDDAISDRLEDLVKDSHGSVSTTIGLSVQQFRPAA